MKDTSPRTIDFDPELAEARSSGSELRQDPSFPERTMLRTPNLRPSCTLQPGEQGRSQDNLVRLANINGERDMRSLGSEIPTDRVVEPIWQPSRPRQEQFVRLQEFEGFVEELRKDSFVARLVDKTEKREDEQAEFSFEEISPSDRDLIQPGAIFYWTIGYLDRVSGQRTRASVIKFRRLPQWTPSELAEARGRASKMRARLGWEFSNADVDSKLS